MVFHQNPEFFASYFQSLCLLNSRLLTCGTLSSSWLLFMPSYLISTGVGSGAGIFGHLPDQYNSWQVAPFGQKTIGGEAKCVTIRLKEG